MKTDDFIRVLAADLPSTPESVDKAAMKWLPLGLTIATLIFFGVAGLRPDMSSMWPVVVLKLLVTLTLAGTAIFVAMRLTRPDDTRSSQRFVLLAPLVVLALLIFFDLWKYGGADFSTRLIGRNPVYCLLMIPLLSLAPLATILRTAQCGAVTRHSVAGGVAGMAAAGFGASLYALYCTDDSMLFVAFWYSLATLVMAALGSVACRLTVRW